tara:strand:+ start:408 stop:587 length:180 start_codon:yes stop_codon:yes gene_type:complete
MELQYKVGDTIVINNKDWVVDEIKMRFGRTWVYGLNHENTDGTNDSLTIETGSLETIMK